MYYTLYPESLVPIKPSHDVQKQKRDKALKAITHGNAEDRKQRFPPNETLSSMTPGHPGKFTL